METHGAKIAEIEHLEMESLPDLPACDGFLLAIFLVSTINPPLSLESQQQLLYHLHLIMAAGWLLTDCNMKIIIPANRRVIIRCELLE